MPERPASSRISSFVSKERRQQAKYFAQFDPASLMPGWPYRLAREHWTLNLAPSVRETAPEYFRANGIQWHTHANHALSSQVCCVNFLGPLARRPTLLARVVQAAVGGRLPVMLPVEREPDGTEAFVGFEWIGAHDYLNEAGKSGGRSRGANATAADAVVRFERDGRVETLLIEWKYTESYGAPLAPGGNPTRIDRYRDIAFAPHGPVRADLGLTLEDYFYEPFYQLLRQQMLASQMQKAREGGADSVRVLHISPNANKALRKVTSPRLRPLGQDVFEVWKKALVNSDDFVSCSTETLFAPLLASADEEGGEWAEYLLGRYGFLQSTDSRV